eukprot:CAMPEP_0168334410 /NCGR_PEP_ID=MMETSP0213-20121227/10252_1 /TAXON_ID=151035 /ORGANISM="Euplotes harpa, Strain FSP1.4" /LENGTH=152 /DNA_ID=CAMNT_0008339051 /DNA_START=59 /DNA_END=517 /DNA_ORIENTATION=+
MLLRRQFKNTIKGANLMKSSLVKKYWKSTIGFPLRTYIVKYKPSDTDTEAAEANPIKYFYQDEIIREMTEIQRMMKIVANEPRTYYNIKGLFPEIVEDFNFNALTEPSSSKESDDGIAADIKLDQVDEEQAMFIIYEMNKDVIPGGSEGAPY